MSAIAPRNSSPAIVVERKDAIGSQIKNAINSIMPPGGGGSFDLSLNVAVKDVVLEILILAAAAVAIVIVAYLVFKPLFTGIFQTALDTINTLTDITAETLGTVTEVLGGVIEDASAAVTTVTSTVSSTIGTLRTTISGTLDSIAGPVTTQNPQGGSLTKIANTVTTTVVNITDIIVSQELLSNGKPKGIIPRLALTIESLISITEDLLGDDGGILETIKEFVSEFKTVITLASQEYQAILISLKNSADTVINGIQDGIRYLVDPFINETYGIPAIGNQMLTTITQLTTGITTVGNGITIAINGITTAVNSLSSPPLPIP